MLFVFVQVSNSYSLSFLFILQTILLFRVVVVVVLISRVNEDQTTVVWYDQNIYSIENRMMVNHLTQRMNLLVYDTMCIDGACEFIRENAQASLRYVCKYLLSSLLPSIIAVVT